uniref:Uncharacterized protein n=1 Tax=Pavo cristatus TaxID=9049 RepID=A0A8C9G8R0_PAVCR
MGPPCPCGETLRGLTSAAGSSHPCQQSPVSRRNPRAAARLPGAGLQPGRLAAGVAAAPGTGQCAGECGACCRDGGGRWGCAHPLLPAVAGSVRLLPSGKRAAGPGHPAYHPRPRPGHQPQPRGPVFTHTWLPEARAIEVAVPEGPALVVRLCHQLALECEELPQPFHRQLLVLGGHHVSLPYEFLVPCLCVEVCSPWHPCAHPSAQ